LYFFKRDCCKELKAITIFRISVRPPKRVSLKSLIEKDYLKLLQNCKFKLKKSINQSMTPLFERGSVGKKKQNKQTNNPSGSPPD